MFFISYQSDSHEAAYDLEQRIQNAGMVTWLFRKDLTVGDQWKEVIDNAIIGATAVIVIVTLKALQSQYVTYEWSFALGKGKRVIPFILERAKNRKQPQMHPRLGDYQYADTLDPNFDWGRFINELRQIEQTEERPQEVANAEADLQSSDPVIRLRGIHALRDNMYLASLAALKRALHSSYADVIANAAIAYAQKTNYQDDDDVIHGLMTALERGETQDSAFEILATINSAAAVRAVANFVNIGPGRSVTRVRKTILKFTHQDVVPELCRLLNMPDYRHPAFIAALREFSNPFALPFLFEYFEDFGPESNDIAVRTQLVQAIATIGGSDAVNLLTKALYMLAPKLGFQANKQVFEAVLTSLEEIGDEDVLQAIDAAYKDPALKNARHPIEAVLRRLERKLMVQ